MPPAPTNEDAIRTPHDILLRAARPQWKSSYVPTTRDWRYKTRVYRHSDYDTTPQERTIWDKWDLVTVEWGEDGGSDGDDEDEEGEEDGREVDGDGDDGEEEGEANGRLRRSAGEAQGNTSVVAQQATPKKTTKGSPPSRTSKPPTTPQTEPPIVSIEKNTKATAKATPYRPPTSRQLQLAANRENAVSAAPLQKGKEAIPQGSEEQAVTSKVQTDAGGGRPGQKRVRCACCKKEEWVTVLGKKGMVASAEE
ncbi:hypothetical protein M011DRAFT_481778 [Sporormia fimetaria CBS 119925]|uniref:Uncharacterized protein n=1 Tax=Sporormia fimetaria CBS 119925 TaxID=1340428 RepID=A0A6A6UXS1_9PLEO|nr:hypothetical protein M011DRAFT_481778 [Sporormia fimetaria CBS 119925]